MRREIETLAEFDAQVRAERSLAGCLVVALDLRGRGAVLGTVGVHNAFFLGCRLKHPVAAALAGRGATVFPRLPQVPFDAYPAALYTAEQLYASLGDGYAATPDARVYGWTLRDRSAHLDATLAQALHDHFIGDALAEAVSSPGSVVGLLGGHAVPRGAPEYGQTAHLARGLAEAGLLVFTGGGPGLMEAGNLGASLRGTPSDLDAACAVLAATPRYAPDITAWASGAFEVKRSWDCTRASIGVPTWFYGHEPPNAFATAIAKYFDNALREDALLRLCGAGLVYAPGTAGTTQEIFAALTRNYYALELQHLRPMVLVGRRYWTDVVPAWPLLTSLSRGRLMETHVHLVDTAEEVLDAIGEGMGRP